jgi:hypothetical protein
MCELTLDIERRFRDARLAKGYSTEYFEHHDADLDLVSICIAEANIGHTGFPGIMNPARKGERTLSESMMLVVARIMQVGI